jgi:hypothetical protein
MYTGDEAFSVIESNDDVTAYKVTSAAVDYTTSTVFRVVEEYTGNYLYFKNVQSVVKVCTGNRFSFRNSPTFYDIANPELISAYQETEAYIDYVHKHANTPPFVCTSLLKLFGYSNPTPPHVLDCSTAFKTGTFTFTNPDDASDSITFGVAGERGNLKAVASSIVLSSDALSPSTDLDPGGGCIKSPLLRLTQVMRSFKLTRTLNHRRTDGFFNSGLVGEGPYNNPDQFSFYDPHFLPAGAHREAYLHLPEAELLTMNYVADSQNAMYNLLKYGLNACDGGVGPYWIRGNRYRTCGDRDRSTKHAAGYLDFTPTGDRSDAANVVGQLATILTADRLSHTNRARIEAAYTENYSDTGDGEQVALETAQVLMISTPEFHTTSKVDLSDNARVATPPRAEKDPLIPYKAIVHVYLFGGLDSMNLLTPHPDGCADLYDEYRDRRGDQLSLTEAEMHRIDIDQSLEDQPDQPCSSFGVHMNMPRLRDIFDAGDGLFIANIGHLQKSVNRNNFVTDTTAQLFSHHSMKEEGFNVDAFNERDNSGVLGRMNDVIGNSMATGQISIDRHLGNLLGDPTLGRKVDILSQHGNGVNQFYRVNMSGPNTSKRDHLLPIMRQLNSKANEGSSINADLWSQIQNTKVQITARN